MRKYRGSSHAESLTEVIRILKQEGYFVLTISERVMEIDTQNYETAIEKLPVKVIQHNDFWKPLKIL